MEIKTVNCAGCRYWQQVPDEDGHELGLCRRYPPSYQGWAMSESKDWCAEFQPREPIAEA